MALQEEKSTLQSLPQEEFSLFQRGVRKVNRNCHIHFENNYYSVPGVLVGKDLVIRWNERLLRIIHQTEQVALHTRAAGTGNYITVRSHMPEYKTYSETEYQERYEKRMSAIGEHAHAYFHMLLVHKRNYWGRVVRGILGMVHEYGEQVVDKSLARAMYFNATDLVTIKNIADKKLYREELEPKLSLDRDSKENRSLSYYKV